MVKGRFLSDVRQASSFARIAQHAALRLHRTLEGELPQAIPVTINTLKDVFFLWIIVTIALTTFP